MNTLPPSVWSESALGACPAVRRVRALHQRTLRNWAMDALSLRRRGLDRPGLRAASSPAAPLARAA